MTKKVLITGSNGLLGQKLVNLFSLDEKYKVHAVSLGKNRNETAKNYTYYNLDITNSESFNTMLYKESPEIIINCAAITNVDQCETDKELCDKLNVEAVKNLVGFCKEKGAHLVHISTDFIFDGEAGPYSEEDTPNPVNYYGLSKLKSEEIIKSSAIYYTILRTILVYGIVDNMNKGNIVLFVKQALEQQKQVTMVDDQFRMPTLADNLAQACYLAVVENAYGVFHVSSSELMSIYDMALQIAEVFKLDATLIKRISTGQLRQPAKRPKHTGFYVNKVRELGLQINGFKEDLFKFKNQLKQLS